MVKKMGLMDKLFGHKCEFCNETRTKETNAEGKYICNDCEVIQEMNTEQKKTCPICSNEMKKEIIEGIIIDRCQEQEGEFSKGYFLALKKIKALLIGKWNKCSYCKGELRDLHKKCEMYEEQKNDWICYRNGLRVRSEQLKMEQLKLKDSFDTNSVVEKVHEIIDWINDYEKEGKEFKQKVEDIIEKQHKMREIEHKGLMGMLDLQKNMFSKLKED